MDFRIWLGALIHIFNTVQGVEIDNGVVGEPTISCGTEKISLWVKTRNPFNGKTFVKGEYGRPECSRNFYGTSTSGIHETTPLTTTRPPVCPPCPVCPTSVDFNTVVMPGTGRKRRKRQQTVPGGLEEIPEMAHLTVLMNTCNMKRERSLNPPGVTVRFTTVVSFHDHFLTKVDKAYQIRCFYMEADKTVSSEIDVSMPQTTELIAQATMPTCYYTIRRGSPEGPEVKFAKVGDKVFHRWECTSEHTSSAFGMLVHSCYVNDGQGQSVQIINERGCSNDPFAIQDLTYAGSLLAYVEAHVFKFADRAVLDFQCAITICVAADGACEGITPPSCSSKRKKRDLVAEAVNKSLSIFDTKEPNQINLHAQRVTVVDLDDNIKSEELMQLEKRYVSSESETETDGRGVRREDSRNSEYYRRILSRISPRVCLSVVGFGVLVALCTFIFTIAAAVLGTVYVLRKKDGYSH